MRQQPRGPALRGPDHHPGRARACNIYPKRSGRHMHTGCNKCVLTVIPLCFSSRVLGVRKRRCCKGWLPLGGVASAAVLALAARRSVPWPAGRRGCVIAQRCGAAQCWVKMRKHDLVRAGVLRRGALHPVLARAQGRGRQVLPGRRRAGHVHGGARGGSPGSAVAAQAGRGVPPVLPCHGQPRHILTQSIVLGEGPSAVLGRGGPISSDAVLM